MRQTNKFIYASKFNIITYWFYELKKFEKSKY